MKPTKVMMAATAVALLSLSVYAADEQPARDSDASRAKVQTHCPVMGGKVNPDVYVDVKGKRIFLCCLGCADAIRKNPDKYIKKLEDAGVTIALAPEKPKKPDDQQEAGKQ